MTNLLADTSIPEVGSSWTINFIFIFYKKNYVLLPAITTELPAQNAIPRHTFLFIPPFNKNKCYLLFTTKLRYCSYLTICYSALFAYQPDQAFLTTFSFLPWFPVQSSQGVWVYSKIEGAPQRWAHQKGHCTVDKFQDLIE